MSFPGALFGSVTLVAPSAMVQVEPKLSAAYCIDGLFAEPPLQHKPHGQGIELAIPQQRLL